MNAMDRAVALIAFLEERDRQLRLPFPEDGGSDCGQQSDGRFGAGNNCASDGSGSSSSSDGGSGSSPTQSSNSGSSAIKSISNGLYSGDIKGAEKISSLTISDANEVKSLLKDTNIDDLSTLLEIGVGNSENSKTTVSHLTSATWASGERVPFSQVRVGSSVPVDPSNASAGTATVTVMIEKHGEDPPFVHYGFLQRDGEAQRTIKKEKEANPDTGYSKTEADLGAAIFDRMLSSLDAARKAGIGKAVTEAAGFPGSDTFQGYRLWGRFGFDAPLIPADVESVLRESLLGKPVVSEEIAVKAGRTKSITLQELLSTKQGEAWWKKNGSAINMTLDFTDKDSVGMKRFEKMLSMRERSKSRGSRSYLEFIRYASRADVSQDLAEWRGFRESDLEERLQAVFEFASQRNCGTGSGGFVKGNTCASGVASDVAKGATKGAVTGAAVAVGKTAGFPPAVAAGATAGAAIGAVKGLYDSQMRPTRAGKAIAKVGTTDEKIASLVKSLGGANKSLAEADGKDALSLQVKDSGGKRLFDVRLTKDGVTIKPSPGRDSLTPSQIASIKEIAKEHHDVKVVVQDMPATAISRIAKAGFSLAYDAAVGLVAGFTVPMLPAVAGTAIESTTGFDIEASGVVQPFYNVLDKVADKVIR
jgi:hypothetical protein